MALTTQLCVSSIAQLLSPSLSKRSSNSKKNARISISASSPFSRRDVREKLYNIGTLRILPKSGRKQRGWVLQASGEKEVVSTDEKTVAADSTGTKNVERSSNGPPVLTVLAGLVVLAGFLWVAGSVLLWFIGLLFR